MPHIALELGKNAASLGVKSAYGETQEVDGAHFTPVALTMSGFGGGGIDAAGASGDASGGGGGGFAIPLGVYVRREEGLRFEPNFVSLLAVAIPFVWVAGRAIARIIRVLKK
ncbi:putative spore protein YtfJ [Microbacterium resistens]|uniref:Spore protein YtfJ n=1 Tax=Microbacterium resistens TaxID=156977 RepID=A0ABU1S8T2_9MICO|nr:hypothetical protein [Microbacterium resistens]MDR6866030.1 putative spore protein YtfJ [Microbacterium resistens]